MFRLNLSSISLLAVLSIAVPANAQDAVPQVTPTVATQQGEVQGLKDDGIDAYLGIPYAAPPIGQLRFMPPAEPEAWSGIYDATSHGAPCMQNYTPSGPVTTEQTRRIQGIFPTYGEQKIDNEDCLFLNVWTPAADGGTRPVMVWFHGGGYAYGSGNWPAYDGRNLAAKGDVVVVTVNHRLNAFGYMNLAEAFGETYAASGNVGNLDLVRSLEWVRDNIAAFGGDPENVTIMGESGGGSKVSHLMAMPSAAGLFDKAIVQSGPAVTSGDPVEAAGYAGKVLAEAGVDTPEKLAALSSDELLSAVRRATPSESGFGRGPSFGPIADGTILPRDPFLPSAPEQSSNIPLLIGYNKDEMTLFLAAQPWFGRIDDTALDAMAASMGADAQAAIAAYREMRPDYSATHIASNALGARFVQGTYALADQQARTANAPVFVYRLDWETPVANGMLKSPHTLDIPLMFNNAEESVALLGNGEAPARMAAMMSEAWIAFAHEGVPKSALLPEWQPYTTDERAVMLLNLEPEIAMDPERTVRTLKSR
ncbi:carboxylesterase/lipase family protein [Erythrobacter litoralis]|uniref:carboxylesterase/lipase family protein n=1 Tax=Erythrobacter litoralis TaxID=39960 RepID=UPI00243551E2|nr:carboxylesterase/lipase family protein [Erythrobacter litoralis]MDG6080267.1 carboxylesterase/lipase family protein [Erythrobacter litoralis]